MPSVVRLMVRAGLSPCSQETSGANPVARSYAISRSTAVVVSRTASRCVLCFAGVYLNMVKFVAKVQVEWQSKKLRENNVTVLKANLEHLFAEDEGTQAYLDCVKEYSESVPPEEVIKVIWTCMVGSVNTVGKNQMQLLQKIVKTIKQNKALLETHTKALKLELALLNCLQVTCYEDSKLLKVCLPPSLPWVPALPVHIAVRKEMHDRQRYGGACNKTTPAIHTHSSCVLQQRSGSFTSTAGKGIDSSCVCVLSFFFVRADLCGLGEAPVRHGHHRGGHDQLLVQEGQCAARPQRVPQRHPALHQVVGGGRGGRRRRVRPPPT